MLQLVGKGSKPATMPLTVPVLRVLEACRGVRISAPDLFAEEGASLFVDLCRFRVNRRLSQVRCRRVTPSPWKTR